MAASGARCCARALENGVHVAGCCVAASAHVGEECAGAGNHVFDPLGTPVETKDDHTYELALDAPPALLVNPLEQAVAVDRGPASSVPTVPRAVPARAAGAAGGKPRTDRRPTSRIGAESPEDAFRNPAKHAM